MSTSPCDHYIFSHLPYSFIHTIFTQTNISSFALLSILLQLQLENQIMKSPTFSGSIGSQIIIATEQQRHQKRLNDIYNKGPTLTSKTLNYDYLMRSSFRSPHKLSKKAFNDQMNHHLTLKHLIQRLNSPKTYNQRLKDENDFIAYPSLFFRNTEKPVKKKKTFKPKKSHQNPSASTLTKKNPDDMFGINTQHNQTVNKLKKSKKNKKNEVQQNQKSASVNSDQPHNGLTVQKVMNELPKLQKFEQEDIELFADHLTRLIFKYNLDTIEDIEFLFKCVEQYLADQNYPEHFLCAIEDMFKEIVSSLNIEQ